MRMTLLIGLACCAIGGNAHHATAQSIPVPGARQASILTRALAYSRTIKERAGDAVVVGVIYLSGHSGSEAMANDVYLGFKTLESFAVRGLPFRVTRIAYTRDDELRRTIREAGVDALFVCAGLDDAIASIASIARETKVISFGGVEDYVTQGLSLGVFVVATKPTIYFNKTASLQEEADFAIEFVQLTTPVDGR